MIDGLVAPGFEPVRAAFAEALDGRPGTGATAAAAVEGRWVVDLWGGFADGARTRPWQRDSLVMPYSVSKPFVGLAALMLVDRGLLELDAPVQRYWPEFVTEASVRHVLSHQAGVVALDAPAPTDVFYDWEAMCALLAAQTPTWEPGTAHGESALFYGHLVGELVRRVDGRTPGRFLREEVDLEFVFGLTPEERERAVELTGLPELAAERLGQDAPELYQRAVQNPPGAFDPSVVNGARWRAAEVPAVNGHGTARGVAGLYAALLVGELLSPDLLTEATTAQTTGIDRVFGHDNTWGLGFGLDDDGFGMGGTGGSVGWASRVGGYAFAFLTGHAGDFAQATAVENALRDCLGVPPLTD